jgi:hypothetical protein
MKKSKLKWFNGCLICNLNRLPKGVDKSRHLQYHFVACAASQADLRRLLREKLNADVSANYLQDYWSESRSNAAQKLPEVRGLWARKSTHNDTVFWVGDSPAPSTPPTMTVQETIEWIPVENEMPRALMVVLAATVRDFVFAAYWDALDQCWHTNTASGSLIHNVTHWANMPSGPNKEKA